MPDYQFTIKLEHVHFVPKVKEFIRARAVSDNYDIIETKDGTIFMMEFEEQYQANKFDQDLKVSHPYLFIE